MLLQSILSPERTFWGASGTSKKRALLEASRLLAETIPQLTEDQIFDAIINREKLGSTALGNGIAIPHCRIENCAKTIGALLKLDTATDFESPDDKPVDLLFILLVPVESTDTHLETLAMLAGLFQNEEFCAALRRSTNSENLYQLAVNTAEKLAA